MQTSNTEQIAVVTGANAGIGKAVVEQLAQAGCRVAAVCRDTEKGATAVQEILARSPGARIDLVQGDLSTIAGTRDLAARLLATYPRINVLVNNAGVWMTRRVLTPDGLETTFMVNHVAPFLLTHLLLDTLKESEPARIVMVNAGLYANGEADLEQLPAGENFHRFKTYMHSKLLNVYITLELADRLKNTRVTVNALHPGVIRTNLGASSGLLGLVLKAVKHFWSTPETGARTVVHLALSPELDSVSGAYFNEMKQIPLADNARDPEIQKAVWSMTARIAGVDPSA